MQVVTRKYEEPSVEFRYISTGETFKTKDSYALFMKVPDRRAVNLENGFLFGFESDDLVTPMLVSPLVIEGIDMQTVRKIENQVSNELVAKPSEVDKVN